MYDAVFILSKITGWSRDAVGRLGLVEAHHRLTAFREAQSR